MNYVCLRIRIFRKIVRRREMPVLPFWLFLYGLLCSSQQNLFLKSRNLSLSLNYALNHYYFLIWSLLFRSLNLTLSRNPSLKNVRHHEKPDLPSWLFLYAQLYS